MLRKELQDRLDAQGSLVEWADVIQDLGALEEVEVEQDGKRFLLRGEPQPGCSAAFQVARVALPPTVQRCAALPGEPAPCEAEGLNCSANG